MHPDKQSNMNAGSGDLPPELKSLEAALAALVPRTELLDSQRLMFEAGRRSAIRAARTWRIFAAAMTTLAAMLLVMLVLDPGPRVVERIVYVPAPSEATGPQSPPAAEKRVTPADHKAIAAISPSNQQQFEDRKTQASDPRQDAAEMPYGQLRARILRDGIEVWRSPSLTMNTAAPASTAPRSYGELRKETLKSPDSAAIP